MKTTTTKLALTLSIAATLALLPGVSRAAVITYSNNYSGVTESAPASIAFGQFNPILGSLSSINLTVYGQSVGSFDVATTTAFSTTITGSSLNIVSIFTGVGAPAPMFGTPLSPVSTLPVNVGYVLPGNTGQTFSLLNNPQALSTLTSGNLIANAGYFSGLGSVNLDVNELLLLSYNNNRPKTLSYTNLVMDGAAVLTYTYDPAGAVPEPGTWAAAGLLLAFGAFRVWRRRQQNLQDETAAA